MGYELNKLMEQYGVSTPSLAPKTTDISKEQYEKYKQAYLGRISATPMYTGQQFYTGPSEAVKRLGEEQVKKDILQAIPNAQNMSGQEIRNLMDKYGATGYDLAKARGTFGMWGAPLTYSDFITGTPSIIGTAPGTAPGTEPNVENNMLYKGLTSQSTPEQVAAAYSQYIGSRGGDIEANKKSAVDYLTNLGFNQNAINQAYDAFKSGNYAKGGVVKQYQAGGLNEEPIAMQRPTTTPVSPAANDLMNMISRYTGPSVYEPELKAARARHTEENQNLINMINQMATQQQTGPSKSEMYFRLAAALGQPTRSGTFGETLGNVSQAMAEHQREANAAQQASNAQKLQMMLQAQQMKAAGAKEELSSLQGLTQQEMQDKRALLMEYLKSGRPQSQAGKAALDAGFEQGTPEFNAFVQKQINDKIATGNMFKEAQLAIAQQGLQLKQEAATRAAESAKNLTPAEMKLKSQSETTLGSLTDSMESLKRAYALNPQTFDGTITGTLQRKVMEQTNPTDPRVIATREQENLLSKGAIERLKASFGSNPTEGERAALLALEGINSKSKEERAAIMKNTYNLLKSRYKREHKTWIDVSTGKYKEPLQSETNPSFSETSTNIQPTIQSYEDFE